MSFVTVKKNFRKADIAGQLPFAAAIAITKTARDAQAKVLDEMPDHFTLRGNWWKPSNKFGVRVRSATKQNLVAEVGTDADWLEVHEQGGTRRPKGRHLALPVIGSPARPSIKSKVAKRVRPRNIIDARNAFIMKTRSGKLGIWTFRKGLSRKVKDAILANVARRNENGASHRSAKHKYKGTTPFQLLYGLEGYRTFKKNSAIIETSVKIIAANLNRNFMEALDRALKTAK